MKLSDSDAILSDAGAGVLRLELFKLGIGLGGTFGFSSSELGGPKILKIVGLTFF